MYAHHNSSLQIIVSIHTRNTHLDFVSIRTIHVHDHLSRLYINNKVFCLGSNAKYNMDSV